MAWQDPKVVISDTAPPTVQCRNAEEVSACNAVLAILRRGQAPLAFITRHKESGEVEVHARSNQFNSVAEAMDVFNDAKAKLMHTLFRRHMPARSN